MARAPVQTRFDCGHVLEVRVRLDDDVTVPEQVRGLGKCGDCMKEDKLMPIPGIAPKANGDLVLDSVFMMPID